MSNVQIQGNGNKVLTRPPGFDKKTERKKCQGNKIEKSAKND